MMSKTTIKEVLLVEDNPADIYLIQKAVEECRNDIRLWVVTNGVDALTFLRQEGSYVHTPPPALILLDINLPKMPGTEVLAELRNLSAYHATPVVMFTSARKDLEERNCLHLGANAYVEKPAALADFFAAVQGIVSQWLTRNSSEE
jgi:chemotaxis family two-component system response regulator Rcp1